MSTVPPAPPLLSRIWTNLMLILAAFGIPTATATYILTKHPSLALTIFIFYELGVFILRLFGKVWGKLEDPLVEHISSWFKEWIVSILSRYHRQYYQYLRYQHRDFDVKGLSTLGTYTLELDQVFVELRIDPSTPQSAAVNPVQVPQALFEGSHTVWDYLKSDPLRQLHLVVIGPPGSGKTTLLKHVVLTSIARRKLFRWQNHENRPNKTPILLFLRDHTQAINEQQEYSLINAIQDHLRKWDQPTPPEGWFQRLLNKGRCLIMLDGLDEVADPDARKNVVSWVERQMTKWNRNRFLLTSRPFGYRNNPLPGVAVLEVRPFTLDQVERFVNRWYLANEIMSKQKDDSGVRMRAKAEARDLLLRLRSTPALFELTVNPLLLTMIATVHRFGGELPGNRVALYAEICEVFLGKRQQARGQKLDFTPAQMRSILEPLAYLMMINGVRDIAREKVENIVKEPLTWIESNVSTESFMKTVENISGLFLERESRIYSFAHQTFQEYLAAAYIKRKQLVHILKAQVGNAWWRETIRLYSAMEDASPIIVTCLQWAYPSAEIIELAIDCEGEAQWIHPIARSRLEKFLEEGIENTNQVLQSTIAKAMLARRLRHMVYLRNETYIDTTFITCAEYQIFLNEKKRTLLPDHWRSDHFAYGQGSQPILGVRSSAALDFCDWLTKWEASAWHYRLPTKEELEKENSIQSKLPAGTGYWIDNGKGFTWVKQPSLLSSAMEKEIGEQFHSIVDNCDKELNKAHELINKLSDQLRSFPDNALKSNFAARSTIKEVRGNASGLAQAFEKIRISDLARAFGFAYRLHHIFVSKSGLDEVRVSILAGISILARVFACTCTLALASAGINSRDCVLAANLVCDRARTRDLPFSFENTTARVSAIASAFSKGHALLNALASALVSAFPNDYNTTLSICRVFIVVYISSEGGKQQLQKGRPLPLALRKKDDDQYQRILNNLLDIYLDLLVLKKRIDGSLPAYEGILIVKEKQH